MGGGKAPSPPDYGAAAAQGTQTDLSTYPLRYLTDAAAQMGGKVTIDGKTYDFSGLGSADNSAAMSDQMAQTLLDIQKGLGPAYIQQRIDELKQADPQGYAARKQLFDAIVAQTNAQPDRPLADELQASIVGQLQDAGRLDARELAQVQQQVRGGQVARGNYLGNAATSQEASAVVGAGENLRNQKQQQALGFLQSGVTPEDVKYRRMQQNLANLGAFESGTTPTAQFRDLSGAGTSAAPFIGGPGVNVATNPNAGQMGISQALGLYSGNVNWAQSQVNPWIAGLSTGISAYNGFRNLGGGGGGQNPGAIGAITDQGGY